MWHKLFLSIILVISIYSYVSILSNWQSALHLTKEAIFGSFVTITALAIFTAIIITALLAQLSKRIAPETGATHPKSLPYQLWITIVYSRSCNVWTETITKQQILHACSHILTLGAPKNINWTCVERCDGTQINEMRDLPFITNDATFINASSDCSPWFEDDIPALVWTMSWECCIFGALLVHAFTIFARKEKHPLDFIDMISCCATSWIAFVPQTYYSIYNMGGVFRFLGLMHAIVPFEHKIKTKKIMGLIMVLKCIFVALMGTAVMFVAEKPCHALQDDCDDGFQHFGNTLYFVFVTLSTVGFGDMAPKTVAGKIGIVFIIMASISYLPNIISDVLEMCRKSHIHDRLDEMHEDIRQVNFFMNGGTNKKHKRRSTPRKRLLSLIRRKKPKRKERVDVELTALMSKSNDLH